MRKKLFLSIFIALFLLLCSCDTLGGGDETVTDHTHSYGDWQVTKAATCTDEGEKTGVCTCGDKLVEIIPVLDHVIARDLGLSPTCTEPGMTEQTFCAVCNIVLIPQETIAPTGHFEVIDEAIAPTCTSDGLSEGKHCSVCDEILVAQEKISASHTFEYKYDAHSHSLVCSACGLVKDTAAHVDIFSGYCTVCNAPITVTEGIEYSVGEDGKTASVTGYRGSAQNVVIASEYNGLPVTTIGKNAFSGKDITSLFIPDSITVIEQYALSECPSLKSVKMGNKVKEIGAHAFENCRALEDILLPKSLIRIDTSSFGGCEKLIEVENGVSYVQNIAVSFDGSDGAKLRDGTLMIAEYAFAQKADLVSVTLPDSVVRIGDGAFSECPKLSSVALGESLEYIGEFAFYWCSSIKTLTLPDSVKDIGHSAFSGCVRLSDLDLGSSLSSIAPYAFADCSSLKNVTVPNSVKTIGACAFYNCTSIENMTLPFVGETKDGDGALHFGYIFGATSSYTGNGSYVPRTLKKVVLTNAILVEDFAFYKCSGIESITLPVTVFYIGEGAFSGCTSLSEIIIPDGLATLGRDAFSGCESLRFTESDGALYLGNTHYPRLVLVAVKDASITSCKIDSQVKFIYDGAFKSCSSLKEVIYSGTRQDWEKIRIGENNSPFKNANLTLD